MKTKIGIPRGLFFYKFSSLWELFFEELGVEVVFSDPTNKYILDEGVKSCVDEACLPVKLYHGHVINLKNKVDYIFIPRFTSISRNEYICPMFGGLPDMIRHTLKDLPPIIGTEINLRSSDSNLIKAANETAKFFNKGKGAARAALKAALESYRSGKGVASCSIAQKKYGIIPLPAKGCVHKPGIKIAVIGHPYNVYDKHISMNLLEKLKRLRAEAITIEMLDGADINRHAATLAKPMFWNYGRKAYGAALYLAALGKIEGIICITSFGCGIDSFVHDLIERKIRREYEIPLITITIDEHSGEAGFNTRLEAFIDMLCWRKLDENNISASR